MIIAAAGPRAARLAGEKGDGLIATEPRADIVSAYREAGGKGACYAEVALCCAADEDEAKKSAHHYFRWSATGWPVQAELPDTRGFAAASKHITPEVIGDKIPCGPSVERYVEAVKKYVDAGYDHIILVQIGPDQDYFFELWNGKLSAALRDAFR